jgi:DNA-binding beta-propeller fold protein YncE
MKTSEIWKIIGLFIFILIISGCGNNAVVSVETTNHAPAIKSLVATPTSVVVGGVSALTCEATDQDGDPLSYIWSCSSGALSSASGMTVNWTTPSTAGTYTVNVKVSDGKTDVNSSLNIIVVAASSGTTPAIPSAPFGITVSLITDTTASVGWDAVSGATSYKISYGTDTGASNIGVFSTIINAYSFTGLQANTKYYVKVLASNVAGDSAYSTIVNFTTYCSYAFVLKWGTLGTGNGEFNLPYGVAVNPSGNVYVVDSYNNRIQKFTSTGAYKTKWGGTLGPWDGQFYYPTGVAVDTSGNVYVSDMTNNRIQKFDPNGTFIAKWGSTGTAEGKFNYPYGIAVETSGAVYVADTFNNRIQKFDSNGNFITQWGSSGTGEGQFGTPYGIVVDTSGTVYVADTCNNRIQKFSSAGVYKAQWGSYGSRNGQFSNPFGVAVDTSGNVYVSDSGNSRIQEFDSSGNFITKWGTTGTGDGQFRNPIGIAVDTSGNAYVSDENNNRIQKFSPSP